MKNWRIDLWLHIVWATVGVCNIMIKSADSGVFNTDAMVVERERLKQIFTVVLSAHIVFFYDIDTHARLQRLLFVAYFSYAASQAQFIILYICP